MADEYKIGEKESLFAVTQYDLHRDNEDERIPIFILKLVAGNSDFRFVAQPRALGVSREIFWGYGDTETEALNDCISKISGTPATEVVRPER